MSASASRSGSRKGKTAAGSSSVSHKGQADRAVSSHTVDSDYMETLQQQMKSEAKSSSGPAFMSKKKKSARVVTEEAVDADELKAAMAAALAEGGDSDHSDADDSGDDEGAEGGKAAGKATGGKGGAAAAAASGKTRLIRRADESAEQYKARLKSEMKRRKIERKKAARSEVIKAQMARAHEEALERRAAKQREHQQRVAKEKQAKLEKLERAKALEGLTNKEKRAQKHLWAQADAKRDADEATAAAATTSAGSSSSSAVATPAASTKKGKVAAAAGAPAAAESSAGATTDVALPAHSAWDPYNLHPAILRALLIDLKFTAPTPIQEAVLLPAIRDWKDVSAAATTGSGKTLAFGLPIIHRLLMLQEAPGWTDPRRMQALILTPTRELALQIVTHLEAVARYATPAIRVAAVVGGMAADKQKRVLEKKRPAVLVATPGRLWELIHEAGLQHLSSAYYLRFLVLDEADRMVDFGHFPELEKILTFIDRNSSPESLTRTVRSAVEAFDGFEMLDDDEEEGDKDVTAEAAAAAAEEAAATAKSGKRASKVSALINKQGKVSLPKESDIDWDSFLTEEEVFKQQGRKMPKETSAGQNKQQQTTENVRTHSRRLAVCCCTLLSASPVLTARCPPFCICLRLCECS